MRCDQCEALMINGVFCHETGCPNTHKRYCYGKWIRVYKCRVCDEEVEEGTVCECQDPLTNDHMDTQMSTRVCPKCDADFATHNDDGSCVD